MKTIRTGFAVIAFLLAAFPGAAQDALMSDLERLSAKQACEDLLINYGYYLDEGDLEATIALFSDDASFITGGGEAKGKDAFKPVGRNRNVSASLKAYALLAASADKGAMRVLPE